MPPEDGKARQRTGVDLHGKSHQITQIRGVRMNRTNTNGQKTTINSMREINVQKDSQCNGKMCSAKLFHVYQGVVSLKTLSQTN